MARSTSDGRVGVGEIASEYKGDFCLGTRLDQSASIDLAALVDCHIGEEDPVVGLIDTELVLHRSRGQTDFVADDPASVADPAVGVVILNCVRVCHIACAEEITYGFTGLVVDMGPIQPVGSILDDCLVDGHDC